MYQSTFGIMLVWNMYHVGETLLELSLSVTNKHTDTQLCILVHVLVDIESIGCDICYYMCSQEFY